MGKLKALFIKLWQMSPWKWAGGVLVVAMIERLGLWWLYQPISYSDTHSYRRLADAILGGWKYYDGTRTPGYPLFMAAIGPDERIWLAQMGLGIAITLLLFYIGWQLSGRAWFGGGIALAHTLNLGQLFFEATLLSETLTTFGVILTLAAMVNWLHHPQRRSIWLAAGLGLLSSLTAITRPLFIYLPLWILLFVAVSWQKNVPTLSLKTFTHVIIFILPVVVVLGGWMKFIHDNYHDWALTTMTGFHLVQHTGVFFEYVPDKYASLRDTYLKYRDIHIAQFGTQTNTIWDAIPEMEKASGLSFYDLSRTLTRISIQLIREHPGLYLRNVIEGWWMFWRAPVYWQPDALRWGALVPILSGLILAQRVVLIVCNLLFLVTSLAAVGWKRVRVAWNLTPAWWCILGTVWIASVLQTILDHGDNPRFLIPLQSLVVLWVLWAGIYLRRNSAVRWSSSRGFSGVSRLGTGYEKLPNQGFDTDDREHRSEKSASLLNPRYRLLFMTWLRSKIEVWIWLGLSLILGAALASIDSKGFALQSWVAYSFLSGLGLASLFWGWRWIGCGRQVRAAAWVAFMLRLGVGIALMFVLPIAGYQDNPASRAGYVYKDAYFRDQQAWELATSNASFGTAFLGQFSGDQYGGMLALSAAIYRYLSPDAHRPLLILVLTAVAAVWGTFFVWKAAQTWFSISTAGIAAWMFALFPEGVLLGSSHMREAFVIPASAMIIYSLAKMREGKLTWLAWFAAAGIILLLLQPPVALAAFVIFIGAWFFDPYRQQSWKQVALFTGLLALSLIIVVSIWSNLPSLRGTGSIGIFYTWLQNNFNFQSHLMQRASGIVQKLLRDVGDQLKWLIVLVYGVAQPVLPAALVEEGAWIWRVIGILRAAGWYLLAPFLVYGFLAAFRLPAKERRTQLIWLGACIWAWILIAAANAGGDQWDNPRYRVIFLGWEAILAAWAFGWALVHRDRWLWRWLLVEAVFVLAFTEWYITRHIFKIAHLGIWPMIAVVLGLSALILIGGWLWDRRKKRIESRY